MRYFIRAGLGFFLFSVGRAFGAEPPVIPQPSVTEADRYWRAGDLLAARNEWYRCVVFEDYELAPRSGCDARAAGESLVEFDTELEMAQSVPSPVLPTLKTSKRKKNPRSDTSVNTPSFDPALQANYAQRFVSEARQAKSRGQLDAALRLYRAAQRLEPSSIAVAQEIKGLEAEIN